ncbi:MAG TPA: FGGY-family carbohydrate kinase, partial [Dehalococcoidia bacterium]|jgi:sugar (pentulose or hexulose) kinase
VLEGTACAVRQITEALAQAGIAPTRLTLTGGGARSTLWPQILADALARPLSVGVCPGFPGFEECVGAARCAWVALGRFGSLDAAIAAGAPPMTTIEPSTPGVAAMDRLYTRFTTALASGVPAA